MGLEKLVVKQVVKVAKDTIKLESAITLMEDKLKAQGIKVLEKTGINPSLLPFSPLALVNGKVNNPESFLTPQVICDLPRLSSSQKSKTIASVTNARDSISSIIDSKNKISSALQSIQTPLVVLTTTATTLDNVITVVKTAVKVIKAIPIPTAIIPPSGGIGLPINVLMILSDNLDQLDKLLTYGKGVTSSVPVLTKSVIGMISKTIIKLNALDDIIKPVITTLSFVKVIAELGDTCPNLTEEEIDNTVLTLTADIQTALLESGENSIPVVNVANEKALTDSLKPNANPPLIYEGFTLILEYNPDNEFSFDSRRIRATRNFAGEEITYYKRTNNKYNNTPIGNVVLFNDPEGNGRYSYSLTVQVLFEEVKYKINNYLLGIRGLAPPAVEFR
tara:strand:+ start:1411 stop:2583 length:1173 start_codon:yes stop_codon:yes gene_type:complete